MSNSWETGNRHDQPSGSGQGVASGRHVDDTPGQRVGRLKEDSVSDGQAGSEPTAATSAPQVREHVKGFLDGKMAELCRQKRMDWNELRLDEELNLYESGLLDSFDLYQFLISLEEGLEIELDISEMDPQEFTHYRTLMEILVEAYGKNSSIAR